LIEFDADDNTQHLTSCLPLIRRRTLKPESEDRKCIQAWLSGCKERFTSDRHCQISEYESRRAWASSFLAAKLDIIFCKDWVLVPGIFFPWITEDFCFYTSAICLKFSRTLRFPYPVAFPMTLYLMQCLSSSICGSSYGRPWCVPSLLRLLQHPRQTFIRFGLVLWKIPSSTTNPIFNRLVPEILLVKISLDLEPISSRELHCLGLGISRLSIWFTDVRIRVTAISEASPLFELDFRGSWKVDKVKFYLSHISFRFVHFVILGAPVTQVLADMTSLVLLKIFRNKPGGPVNFYNLWRSPKWWESQPRYGAILKPGYRNTRHVDSSLDYSD